MTAWLVAAVRCRPRHRRLTLASVSPGRALAVDAGCGNGQLTSLLARHFDRVTGLDPSTDLITAAQAAHWFDLPRFYDEVRHIAMPQATRSPTYPVFTTKQSLQSETQAAAAPAGTGRIATWSH